MLAKKRCFAFAIIFLILIVIFSNFIFAAKGTGACRKNIEICNSLDDDCDNQIDEGLTIRCSTNSQCGTNGWSGSAYCLNDNVYKNWVAYTCNNPGKCSSTCSFTTEQRLNKTCSYGCTNGVCNSPPLPPPTNETINETYKVCKDTDGGKNFVGAGSVTTQNASYADYCTSSNEVMEYYCSGINGTTLASEAHSCPYGCSQGACKISNSLNRKDMTKYTSKEGFFVSNLDWKTVLPLIPVTTWTGTESCQKGHDTPGNVCVYPTLIFHESGVLKEMYPQESGMTSPSFSPFGQVGWKLEAPGNCTASKNNSYYTLTQPPEVVKLGETFTQTVTVVNCGTSGIINFSRIWFNYHYVSGTEIKFNGNEGIILPGESKSYVFNMKYTGTPNLFSVDSLIYFMQQYSPTRLTTIGTINQAINNIIGAPKPLGGAVSTIRNIGKEDYFSFWETFDTLVYVQDNYEMALSAASYASLINAPLVIQGTSSDTSTIFSGRRIICIGNVAPAGSSCAESYTLQQLNQKYKDETQTNRIILINPNDYDIFTYQYSWSSINKNIIYDINDRTSIEAPVLASAKHELILSTNQTDSISVDASLKDSVRQYYGTLNNLMYLTIMAAPKAIEFRKIVRAEDLMSRALDPLVYADINNDNIQDWFSGRIQGISFDDSSGYVARDLFYNKLGNFPSDVGFVLQNSSDIIGMTMPTLVSARTVFPEAGYNFQEILSNNLDSKPIISLYQNKSLAYYSGHGYVSSGAISYYSIPLLSNTMAIDEACLTCAYLGRSKEAYCGNIIRQGAIFHMGGTSVIFDNPSFENTMNGIFLNGEDIGTSFKNAYVKLVKSTDYSNHQSVQMLGDPTFDPHPPYKLKNKLEGY